MFLAVVGSPAGASAEEVRGGGEPPAAMAPGAPPAAPAAAAQPRPASQGPTAPETFYDQITRGVIRLEHEEAVRGPLGGVEWISRSAGTGFFVLYGRELYLITARHIADVPHAVRARVSVQNRGTKVKEVIELRIPPESWVFHPQGLRELEDGHKVAPVDVAVARLPWPKDRLVKTIGYCPAPCEGRVIDQFAAVDPEPPTMILVFGFPRDLGFELAEQRPMARMGIVAMVAGDYYLVRDDAYVDARVRLIDAPIFPGNSGSPVFSNPVTDGRFELLGVIASANENYSYAVAEPVSRIAETLDAARAGEPKRGPSWRRLGSGG